MFLVVILSCRYEDSLSFAVRIKRSNRICTVRGSSGNEGGGARAGGVCVCVWGVGGGGGVLATSTV